MIAIHLYVLIVVCKAGPREYLVKKLEIAYHIISWLLPVLFSVLPLTSNSYGNTGAWYYNIFHRLICKVLDSWRQGRQYMEILFILRSFVYLSCINCVSLYLDGSIYV